VGLTSWLRNRLRNRAALGQQRPAMPRFRPMLEALEDRWLPSTLTVTNTLDSGLGSLRYEIGTAQSGDTIVFDKSLSGQTITLGGRALNIDKSLDIEGLGAKYLAISGGGGIGSRVFDVSANSQVTISGLTLQNGNSYDSEQAFDRSAYDGWGGAILNEGTLTLSSCTVSANRAYASDWQGGGGGIANVGGSLTVTNCTLSGNSSGRGGGGILNFGGTLTVTGSTISGNSAAYGGGIYNEFFVGSDSVAIVAQSTISKNTANSADAGGILNDGTLTLSGSTVSQNAAGKGHGGGIYNDGILTILGSVVKGNRAQYGADLYNDGSWSADSGSTIGKIAP